MIINDKIIKTMNYVKETSSRTESKIDGSIRYTKYRGSTADELFFLDYRDIPFQPVSFPMIEVEEEIEVDGVKKKVKVLRENDDLF